MFVIQTLNYYIFLRFDAEYIMLKMKSHLIFSLIIVLVTLCGCSGSEESAQPKGGNREVALQHYLEGSLLEQKGEHAKAILEYQDALRYSQDPAIHYALAKNYSYLGKHGLAAQAGREAVRQEPQNRTYRQTLADIYVAAIDLDNAVREYAEVVRIDSQYLEGWQNLARLTQISKPLRAVEIYEKIIERFGPDWNAYFQLAQIQSGLDQPHKAVDALHGLLALDPSNFEIKKAIGDTYLRMDSVDAALTVYNELAELNPDNLELRAALAHAYLMKVDYDRAAVQFEEVLGRDTLSADDQIRFGQIFVAFIQKDSAVAPYAIKLFERIRGDHPDDWRPYWFLGALQNVTGDDSSALLNFQKVRDLARWNPDGWMGVASLYYDSNRLEEAEAVLLEAKQQLPGEFRIHFLLGVVLQRLHKPRDAAMELERALMFNEESVDAMSALGLVYEELDRHEDGDSMYERGLRLDSDNHLILNNYGYSLAERGIELERALGMARRAVDQQPLNQSYLDTYGWVCYRLSRYEEAEQYILKAIELGSASAVIHEHLGDVYYMMSKKEKAVEYWRKALQLDEGNDILRQKIQRGSL